MGRRQRGRPHAAGSSATGARPSSRSTAPDLRPARRRHSYARWIFFDYLSERYGPGIVKELLTQAAASDAGNDPLRICRRIDDVLAAHGSSLTQTFNGFTAANAGGSYSFPGLGGGEALPHRPHWSTPERRARRCPPAPSRSITWRPTTCSSTAATSRLLRRLRRGHAEDHAWTCRRAARRCRASPMRSASTSSPSTAAPPRRMCRGRTARARSPRSASPTPAPATASSSWCTPRFRSTPVKFRGTSAPHIRVSLRKPARVARRLPVLRFNVRSSGRGTLQVLFRSALRARQLPPQGWTQPDPAAAAHGS